MVEKRLCEEPGEGQDLVKDDKIGQAGWLHLGLLVHKYERCSKSQLSGALICYIAMHCTVYSATHVRSLFLFRVGRFLINMDKRYMHSICIFSPDKSLSFQKVIVLKLAMLP